MKKTRQHRAIVAYRICIGVQLLLLLTVALLCAMTAKAAEPARATPTSVATEPAALLAALPLMLGQGALLPAPRPRRSGTRNIEHEERARDVARPIP